MQFDTLAQWLDWQTALHDKAIELGLDRVRRVALNLGLDRIADKVITVAGTNGKGSTVAAYETWLHHAGYRVASYTSPHLLNYNERIKFGLEAVGDAELCGAFAAVENAREQVSLTYFEFGTLAALYLMQKWQPDFAILEVGLGGRLDAVNIIDADLAHITAIGIDHQAWLGDDREKIGYEKAGVLRANMPVVVNDPEPPQSVVEAVEANACTSLFYGREFSFNRLAGNRLLWRGKALELELQCPMPGKHQAHNLAGVVAGLSQLLPLRDFTAEQINRFFQETRIAGRFEQLHSPLAGKLIVDVGHNTDAARALASSLGDLRQDNGRVVVLLGMLEDKQADLFVEALKGSVDDWWLLTLPGDRGLSAAELAERIKTQVRPEYCFDSVEAAFAHALLSLNNQDIMLVTGSFITVEAMLRVLPEPGEQIDNGSKH